MSSTPLSLVSVILFVDVLPTTVTIDMRSCFSLCVVCIQWTFKSEPNKTFIITIWILYASRLAGACYSCDVERDEAAGSSCRLCVAAEDDWTAVSPAADRRAAGPSSAAQGRRYLYVTATADSGKHVRYAPQKAPSARAHAGCGLRP